ncbi:BnaC02g44280D [Brassica napus]|uniref:BnaC02g44280D protein n=1 Tax=Brassica napus TaxID=3708 RepID=A0A078JLF7_BRANA|nr:unnamed protein product [Brassica napus]CDY67250.1 BnaC02g44280D [Brassica napus]
MALSKSQLATLLILCSLLFVSQSKILKIEGKGNPPDECKFRGGCNTSEECKIPCGPPRFPLGTIGLCVRDPFAHSAVHICCCAPKNSS